MALARHEVTQLLDARRAGSLQSDALWYFLDNVSQAHPFAIDVEWLHVMTERIGGNRHDMQVDIFQYRRRNALLSRQAAYEMTIEDEEAIGAIGVFPGNGVESGLVVTSKIRSGIVARVRWAAVSGGKTAV